MDRRDGGGQRAWSAKATKYVTAWQERAWGEVGEQLGLGWDPRAAYEQLSHGRIPDHLISAQRMREHLGAELMAELHPGGVSELQQLIDEYKERYFVESPTPFEEPGLQSTMTQLLDEIAPAIAENGYELLARPRVATMPSSAVHARTRSIPGTDEVAILFQHGLMLFLRDFAKVLALAIPYRWFDLPFDASDGVGGEPGDEEHQRQAAEFLGDSLVAYVVEGNFRASRLLPIHGHAQVSAYKLLHHMELSVLCHELAHLLLGHLLPLGRAPDLTPWEKEYDADWIGSTIAAWVASGSGAGISYVVALCVYDLALAAFDLIERGISYLTTGVIDGPSNRTHPPPINRRRELLRRNVQGLVEAGHFDKAVELKHRTTGAAELIETLWLSTKPTWDYLRSTYVFPSPIWDRGPAAAG